MEQSMVGKVLSRRAIMPPTLGLFSTMTVSRPPSAQSRAACMPATPPPMTRTRLLTLKDEEIERFVLHGLGHSHAHRFYGLVRVGFLVLADPGDMLPDVGHLEEVPVEAGLLDGPPEGKLVHPGRAGCHNDPVKFLPLDGLL